MPTIKDVAKEANVSVATVSRVINKSPKASPASVELVTQAMKKLGYRPNANARALVRRNSNTLGVLVADVSDPFFGAMVKAIDKVAREQGKQVLIGNGYHNAEDERNALELLINSRCEAIIVHAKGLSDQELIAYAKEVPGIIFINRHIPVITSRCVALDNFKGAYLATEFLISQGHKNIACIASSKDIEDTKNRVNGFLAALEDHNLVFNPEHIVFGAPDSIGGEKAMQELLEKSVNISAIFTYNDNMAAGALAILAQQNILVPEQISIIGFDDVIIARLLRPSLTTVKYPIEEMAEYAARLSLSQANEDNLDENSSYFSPKLVQRASTMSIK